MIEAINKGPAYRVVTKEEYDLFQGFMKSKSFEPTVSTPAPGRGRGYTLGLNLSKVGHSPIVSSPVVNSQLFSHSAPDPHNISMSQTFVPKLPSFSGITPTPKGEVNFDVWCFEVNCILEGNMVSDVVLFQSIRNSLKDQARSMLMNVGSEASSSDVLKYFSNFYGSVLSGEDLMQSFYNDCQKDVDTIASYGARLEHTLSKAVLKGHVLVAITSKAGVVTRTVVAVAEAMIEVVDVVVTLVVMLSLMVTGVVVTLVVMVVVTPMDMDVVVTQVGVVVLIPTMPIPIIIIRKTRLFFCRGAYRRTYPGVNTEPS